MHDMIVLSPCTKYLLCPVNDVVWAYQIKVKFPHKQRHMWHNKILKVLSGISELSVQFPALSWIRMTISAQMVAAPDQEWSAQLRTIGLAWALSERVGWGPPANVRWWSLPAVLWHSSASGSFPAHTAILPLVWASIHIWVQFLLIW